MQLEVGKVVKGKVSGITKFGAFVKLEDGKAGLVHISEISKDFVSDINAYLKLDQEVEVVVLSVDEKGRIALSIRRADELKKKENVGSPADYFAKREMAPKDFEDMMHRFKLISEEKMSDLKKGMQAKRGAGYKRGHRQ
ncbi:MAG TPA: S1 RNA-binding domain-containing protein [Bacillota bacterium]|nr:S1 RNA-binding domain-containing protein [Bacillota bacterium]HOK68098.1 S1 RNA-binding domain-containing protein [Bacillota bacterium]HPP84400.1 S1 RNA-binding domain-containing protein [Bacillota bacterium]